MLFYDEDSKMLFIAMKVGPFDGSWREQWGDSR